MKTTSERRRAIFDGLKEEYKNAGVSIDDSNLELFAKQMTSYKIEKGRLRYIKEDELCDLPGIRKIGGHNNLILQSLLSDTYEQISKPQVIDNQRTAIRDIIQ